MRPLPVTAAVLTAGALLLPQAHAAAPRTALVVADATGDANLSGLHGGAVPSGTGSQASLDIASVTLDTVKKATTSIVRGKRVTTWTPTALKITMRMSGPVSTTAPASYGVIAEHSACGSLVLQVYQSVNGPATYGSLANCGTPEPAPDPDEDDVYIQFTPTVSGNDVTMHVALRSLPRQFRAGTSLNEIEAYTSTAEPLLGYQPTDFAPEAGVDTVVAGRSWKIA